MRHKLLKFSILAGKIWCELMHSQVTWPVKGKYRCQTCWREHAVAWEAAPAAAAFGASDKNTRPETNARVDQTMNTRIWQRAPADGGAGTPRLGGISYEHRLA